MYIRNNIIKYYFFKGRWTLNYETSIFIIIDNAM